jgi:hypothetical protein
MVEPGVVALVGTPLNKFIGVYSGRVPTDHPHEAQIGLVWGDYLIDEIIAGNIRDEYTTRANQPSSRFSTKSNPGRADYR